MMVIVSLPDNYPSFESGWVHNNKGENVPFHVSSVLCSIPLSHSNTSIEQSKRHLVKGILKGILKGIY